METAELVLTPLPPYDFALVLAYLRASPATVVEEVGDDGTYRRALLLDGRPVLLSLRSLGTTAAPRLLLELRGEALDGVTVEAAAALVARVFHLEVDPAPFLAVARADPVFGALVERLPGVRPVLIPDPFEALAWAVLGQQINVFFARKLKRTLVELCGRRLVVDGRPYPLFPEAAAVALLDPEALRARQFSRQKTAYLLELARAVALGELDLPGLALLPAEEALRRLTSFRGVGRWTAEYVLMRGLGFRDVIPAADKGLCAIIGRAYGLGRLATEAEVRALAEQWPGWRGWAAFFWWLTLQQERLARLGGAAPAAGGG